MARRESQAIAGYYPTPTRIVESLGKVLVSNTRRVVLADPCAGEGAAAFALKASLKANLLLVEMEATRFTTLKGRKTWDDRIARGDFFLLQNNPGCANLLWLNPPYDTDRDCRRLEEKFLRRAQEILLPDGLLLFIVPGYALAASAATLAAGFTDLQCWRFPDPEYSAYKQVVLVGRRAAGSLSDPSVLAQVMAWASAPDDLPVFPDDPDFTLPVRGDCRHEGDWTCASMDFAALQREGFNPWIGQRGPVQNVCPPSDLAERFQRRYPVASVPRAAHLSAALASGIFNGVRVTPTSPTSGLPPILVKGVFDKEYQLLEERTNKDGEVTSRVEVQQPKLAVTALDLRAGTFHTIATKASISATDSLEGMSLGDLLDSYGESLMRAMLESCPVLHDPRRGDAEPEIEGLSRPLYPAQTTSVHTALKILRQSPRQGVLLLGEIGSGKTSVALATAVALGKARVLVVCPPHLLDGWKEQVGFVAPQYDTLVLESISDVRRFIATTTPTIGILSRERAKLGHSWKPVSGTACPKCGSSLPTGRDLSTCRERCEGAIVRPLDALAAIVARHAIRIARYLPGHPAVRLCVGGTPFGAKLLRKMDADPVVDLMHLRPFLDDVLSLPELPVEVASWLVWLDPECTVRVAGMPLRSNNAWGIERGLCMGLLLAAPEGASFERAPSTYPSWTEWDRKRAEVLGQGASDLYGYWSDYKAGTYKGVKQGTHGALQHLVSALIAKGFSQRLCGEPLYQAVPEPRRFPLASWICHNARNSYDFLILDEAHELSGEGSAQAHAAQRLLHGSAQTMLLTGSLANGYADSVFGSMQAVSPKFQEAFSRDDRTKFVDQYGYWKRIVQEKDTDGRVVAFGSCTDRVQKSVRKAGMAPGILPLFLLDHLLPVSVTLQKEDLRIGIPPTSTSNSLVRMLPEQANNYRYLLTELVARIKETRFKPGLAGKLWGAMAHLPSYLDRACSGEYSIRWPDDVPDVGGQVICSVPCIDPSVILPKEAHMLALVQEELSRGRNVMVFGWHADVLPRLTRILREAGADTVYLEADKVPTGKRQAWINQHVVKPNKRVMVVNPVVVQTGLNNLIHFHTSIWMENPACNPVIYRQAEGRTDRIGQTRPTEFNYPVYEDSAQEQLHKLLLHKVGVSRSVDGLDPEAALRSAGVYDDSFAGLSVGRELYRMITGN